jgi:hypothetical protein
MWHLLQHLFPRQRVVPFDRAKEEADQVCSMFLGITLALPVVVNSRCLMAILNFTPGP